MTDRGDRAFFGHPRGLGYLAGTELWERFSFYGMQALLMLYMTRYLFAPERAAGVIGLAQARALLAPPSDLAFAAQLFGLYGGMIYATPLAGAWLGDRVLGRTRTVTLGALLMSAGHLAMASEALFLVALGLLVVGAGCLIGNMAAQVGQLYAPDDARRTRAFALYLIALNAGALVSPLIVGTLGERVGWHWGFGAAGIGMLLGLTTYLAGRRHLPPDVVRGRERRAPLTRTERRSVAAIVLVLIPYVLANTALWHAYGLILVWGDDAVDRAILGWELPVTWVLTFDGLATIAGIFFAAAIWKRLNARGREPGDIAKLGVGCALVGAAFAYLALMAQLPAVPVAAWLVFYAIMDFGIGWSEAPTAALVSRNAPASINATMMAVFKGGNAASLFLVGWLGRFYEPLGASLYWALCAALAFAGLVLITLFGGRVARMLAPAVSAP